MTCDFCDAPAESKCHGADSDYPCVLTDGEYGAPANCCAEHFIVDNISCVYRCQACTHTINESGAA